MSEKENNQSNQEPNEFKVPGDYFARSANSIFNKIEWEEEHKEFVNLLKVRKNDVFGVPEGYFDKKEDAFELLVYPKLFAHDRKNNFGLPQNYFESCAESLVAQSTADEKFESLDALKKENPFTVDAGYFKNKEKDLTNLLQVKKPARVIQLFSKTTIYSAAAILTIVLSLWVYKFYFNTVEAQDCGTMACIDKSELLKSGNLENLDNDELYELVNANELEQKLEDKESSDQKNNKTDSSLKDVSVEDLMDEL